MRNPDDLNALTCYVLQPGPNDDNQKLIKKTLRDNHFLIIFILTTGNTATYQRERK